MPEQALPKTMRAAQGKAYGDVDEMISVEDGVPVPTLSQIPKKELKRKALVRTLAVALAPGDPRVLSGRTSPLQGPPSFPYIPGGDACGVVLEIGEGADVPFRVGDTVAALFHGMGPRGALGEYAIIHTTACDKVPENVSPEGAAALVSSGKPAVNLANRLQGGERVLIFGAGGGIGSHLCQLARIKGASYVAGVSKDTERLLKAPLSVDRAIDYNKEDPWTIQEWIDNPFDVIFDMAAAGAWLRILKDSKARKPLIIKAAKDGGRYITTTWDEPCFDAHSMWKMYKKFLFPAIPRAIYSRTVPRNRIPKYTFAAALDLGDTRPDLTEALTLAGEGKLVPCIDPKGPFPFTTEGVCRAFKLQQSRHVRGKTVIHVSNK